MFTLPSLSVVDHHPSLHAPRPSPSPPLVSRTEIVLFDWYDEEYFYPTEKGVDEEYIYRILIIDDYIAQLNEIRREYLISMKRFFTSLIQDESEDRRMIAEDGLVGYDLLIVNFMAQWAFDDLCEGEENDRGWLEHQEFLIRMEMVYEYDALHRLHIIQEYTDWVVWVYSNYLIRWSRLYLAHTGSRSLLVKFEGFRRDYLESQEQLEKKNVEIQIMEQEKRLLIGTEYIEASRYLFSHGMMVIKQSWAETVFQVMKSSYYDPCPTLWGAFEMCAMMIQRTFRQYRLEKPMSK